MSIPQIDQMRYFAICASSIYDDLFESIDPIMDESHDKNKKDDIVSNKLKDIVYKLRSMQETEHGGEYAEGYESGLEVAANLLESVLNMIELENTNG